MIQDLISKTVTPSEWCGEIFKKQALEVYSSQTSPSDLNHIVKKATQSLIDYLKSQEKTCMKEVDNSSIKEALSLLIDYLRTNSEWKPLKAKPLCEEELEHAFTDLYVRKYIKGDRKFKDPEIRGQNYALFSFTPSSTAQPDQNGLYGFIKVRGTFNRVEEAEEKSKELIQYFSANQIFVCETGSPVPLQKQLKENVVEVENPHKDENSLKFQDLIKEQGLKEKQQIEEIKQREEELRRDVQKDPKDKSNTQIYIELNHKRATAAYLYNQHKQKLEETKNVVISARKQIAEMDEKYPELKDKYIEHYRETCAKTGIDKASDDMAVMIRKYIGEDPDLGF
jgi:hypothetical protein